MKTYEHITKSIYVVDDDMSVARYNAFLLKQHLGLTVKIYSNPCEAFKDIMKFRDEFGGLITDAFMFVEGCRIQTGIQLVKEIKVDGIPDAPVLFCTSLDGTQERDSMADYGLYCTKPLEQHILNIDSDLHKFLEMLK